MYRKFLQGFESASHHGFDYRTIFDDLDRHSGTHLFTSDLSGAVRTGKETVVVDYRLGSTARSGFDTTISVPGGQTNALHLFFRAELSGERTLTSCVDDPMTHWRHSFVRVPANGRELRMSYSSRTRRFTLCWLSEVRAA